jgi:photosystem II stability/assembly factor-like uncharacterized protein
LTGDPPHGQLIDLGEADVRSDRTVARHAAGCCLHRDKGLPDWRITDLAISPDDPLELYAIAGAKIFKTTTGGEAWVEIHHYAADRKLQVRRLLALQNDVVLAVTSDGKLLRSTDGGTSWRVSQYPCSEPFSLDPNFQGDVKASSRESVICGGNSDLFSSDDGGASWRSINGIPVAGRRSFAFGADGSTYVSNSQAVFRSENGRTGWQRFADFPSTPGFRLVSDIHVSRSGFLFAAINGEVWALRSGSWSKVVEGPGAGIGSLAAANPRSERIYAASGRHGVFVGREADSSWRVSAQGFKNVGIRDVAVSPYDPSLVFAAGTSELFRSDDPARSWQELTLKAGSWVTVSPEKPNVAFASNSNRLLRTTDRGESWSVIRSELALGFAVAPSDPSVLYAAFTRGLAKSTDGGESWSMAMSNMPLSHYASMWGFSADITVDPRDSSTVYAGHEAGLYKTTNGGASWTSLSQPGARIAVDPNDPAILFGIFPIRSDWGWGVPTALSRSNDGGTSWKRLSLPDELIADVIIDPSAAGVVYASSELAVYRSSDYGESWSSFSHGLRGPVIRRLAIDASGHHLFAATSSGVYEYEISAVDLAPVPAAGWNLPDLLERLVQSGAGSTAGFVLPVVGLVEGGSGLYRTAVAIRNGRPIEQQAVIAWLPEGGGPVSFFRMTLPAASGAGSTDTFAVPDVMRRLGLEGLGTMVAVAIDGDGEFDSAASIGGSATICLYRFDRNPACHSVPAARAGVFRPHLTATATGLRHDSEARTNIGITNLDGRPHRYTVNAIGEQTRQTFVIDVPPFSLIQRAIPPGTYGSLTLEVSTDDPSAPWLFYGSTVEIRSGVSVTHLGTP